MVDIDDNAYYRGTKTNHFKIHTFFGDTFDESNFDVRCRVTGDNGEAYSQIFNFTYIDRTVVNSINVSGLSTPVNGKTPSYNATTSAEEYSVTKVEWYGPKSSDGNYNKMYTNQYFEAGDYFCRLHITPGSPYRFDTHTIVTVNGTYQKLTTVDGSTLNPRRADEYYIDVPYTVGPALINKLSANVTAPVDGALPNATVTPAGEGYETTDVDWSYYDATADEYYIMPDGMKFEAGKTYECAVQFDALDKYTFADNKGYMVGYINGYRGVISPVYSNKKAYVTVKFTVPENDPLTVIFTPGSKPEAGNSLTVDIEAMAEKDETLMEAYFNGEVKYKWFYDGLLQVVTSPPTYEIKKGMVGHYIGVKVCYGDKSVSSDEYQITEASGLLGDANDDSEVNILDATLVQSHVAKLDVGDINITNADVDNDGYITIQDATAIQMYVAKMINDFENL